MDPNFRLAYSAIGLHALDLAERGVVEEEEARAVLLPWMLEEGFVDPALVRAAAEFLRQTAPHERAADDPAVEGTVFEGLVPDPLSALFVIVVACHWLDRIADDMERTAEELDG